MTAETVEILYPSGAGYHDLFGIGDRNIRMVEERYGVQIVCRDGAVKVIGNKTSAKMAAKIIKEMDTLISSGTQIDEHTLLLALDYLESDSSKCDIGINSIVLNAKGRQIKPRSLGQCIYVASMMKKRRSFCDWPCRNGKDFSCCCNSGSGP